MVVGGFDVDISVLRKVLSKILPGKKSFAARLGHGEEIYIVTEGSYKKHKKNIKTMGGLPDVERGPCFYH